MVHGELSERNRDLNVRLQELDALRKIACHWALEAARQRGLVFGMGEDPGVDEVGRYHEHGDDPPRYRQARGG